MPHSITLLRTVLATTFLLLSLLSLAQSNTSITEMEENIKAPNVSDTTRIELLGKLSSAYRMKDPEKATMFSKKAILEARTLNNPTWLAKALVSASSTFIEVAEYKLATQILKEAIDIGKKHNIPDAEIRAYSNLGAVYRRIGDPNKAAELMSLAFDKAKDEGNENLMANISLNIGNLYIDIGDYQKALDEFAKCLSPLKKQQDWNAYALTYMNIGVAYTNLKKFERAKIAFDSSQYVIDNFEVLPVRQINLSISEAVMYLDGLKEPNTTIGILEKMMSKEGQALPALAYGRSLQLLALAYLESNQPQKALIKANESINFVRKMQVKTDLGSNVYEITSKIHASLGNWQQAHHWAHESITLRDSLDYQAQRQTASFAMVKREIESNEKELRESNIQLEVEQKVYSTALLIGIPALLLLFATVYFRSMHFKSLEVLDQKVRLNAKLEQKVTERTKDLEEAHIQIQETKERENISLAMLNQQHSELLEHTIEKMKQWQKTNSLSEVQSSINELKSAQTRADEWGDFMLHFKRMHPDFSKKLLSYAPDLSPNDLKHCAYMRLGMSRKQVAETLHTTDNAVRLARNRIGKKLNIGQDESIQEFINTL